MDLSETFQMHRKDLQFKTNYQPKKYLNTRKLIIIYRCRRATAPLFLSLCNIYRSQTWSDTSLIKVWAQRKLSINQCSRKITSWNGGGYRLTMSKITTNKSIWQYNKYYKLSLYCQKLYVLKRYFAQFSLQKLSWNCYIFQKIATYNDEWQINDKVIL